MNLKVHAKCKCELKTDDFYCVGTVGPGPTGLLSCTGIWSPGIGTHFAANDRQVRCRQQSSVT